MLDRLFGHCKNRCNLLSNLIQRTKRLDPFDAEQAMIVALQQAELAAQRNEVPVGAVLWSNGRIIAVGRNAKESTACATEHAEIAAIRAANRSQRSWRLPPDSILVVTLEPCLMCTGALIEARVSKIIYGCADTKGAGLSLIQNHIETGRFDHRCEIIGGVLAERCSAQLSSFFKKRRQQNSLLNVR